jgi:hypothetical protein
MNELLNTEERNELERCEVVIRQGLETFIEVGQALMIIRDKRLYRSEFSTFDDYCRDMWGMAKSTAYQYIEASNVVENVRHGGQILPSTERQARPLTALQPEVQRQAWAEVVQQSQATGQPITAARVQEVASTFKQAKQEYREARETQRTEQLVKKTEGTTVPIDQLERIAKLEAGQTVVLNMNQDHHLLKFATDNGLYVRCDRFSEWGNPFIMGGDGDRDQVCNNYENNYLPYKPSLYRKIASLKGKALGCHCYPERCHCDTLKRLADEA